MPKRLPSLDTKMIARIFFALLLAVLPATAFGKVDAGAGVEAALAVIAGAAK